jgi:SAM-dependent methyltransferase
MTDASLVRPDFRLRTPEAGPVACKVCIGEARLYGVTDFNRSCEEARGHVLPMAGHAVYYRRCAKCGLLFTDAFDDWRHEDFETHIYNAAYVEVDPDFATKRPDSGAEFIAKMFAGSAGALSVLDYGGGDGRFAGQLRAAGFPDTATFDPFHPDHRTRPQRRFDLVTCFETLEHMPDPRAGVADIADLLNDDALVLFSTVVQPSDFESLGMRWWYIGPRNGHVTLYTRAALAALWGSVGLQVASMSDNMHAACRTIPAFARHLFQATPPATPG